MEDSAHQRLDDLKERIFLLQIEERRSYAVLISHSRNEQLKAHARTAVKDAREKLAVMTKELEDLEAEIRKARRSTH